MSKNKLNYIDLFAGAGGLSEGFIQSGYKPVAHVEMNEHAAKTIETRIAYYYLKDNGKISRKQAEEGIYLLAKESLPIWHRRFRRDF